jgi:hypothetical protein
MSLISHSHPHTIILRSILIFSSQFSSTEDSLIRTCTAEEKEPDANCFNYEEFQMCVKSEQVGHWERYDLLMIQYPQKITALYFKYWEGYPPAA